MARRTILRAAGAVDSVSDRVPEWRLQVEACAGLESLKAEGLAFEYAASLEGVRLGKRQAIDAKAQGMQAGEPDLRIYLPGGRLVFIELKGEGGGLNKAQKVRIPKLRALGFVVHVVQADKPAEMRAAVCAIVREECRIHPLTRE